MAAGIADLSGRLRGEPAGCDGVGELVDCCRNSCVLWDQLTGVDNLGLSLDRAFELVDNLSEGADLVKAVLAFFDRAEIEVELDLFAAVSDLESYLMPVVRVFAADVFLAGVFDDCDDIRPHVAELVEELASLNVIFLGHFLFLWSIC